MFLLSYSNYIDYLQKMSLEDLRKYLLILQINFETFANEITPTVSV